jgi:hypothetical protein
VSRGRLMTNGRLVKEGIKDQKQSASGKSCGSTMLRGGGWVESISSVPNDKKIALRLLDVSSVPTRSTAILPRVKLFLLRDLSASSTMTLTRPSTVPPPTNRGAAICRSIPIRGWRCVGNSRISRGTGLRIKVPEGVRLEVSEPTASSRALTCLTGEWVCPRYGMVRLTFR